MTKVKRLKVLPSTKEGTLELEAKLEELLVGVDWSTLRANDPVSFVHRYSDPLDQELVGLLSALLAFGNVKAVRNSIQRVLNVLGNEPSVFLQHTKPSALFRALENFVHRVYRGADVAHMLAMAARLQATYGSLGAFVAFSASDEREGVPDFATEKAPFYRAIRGLGDALRGDDTKPVSRGLQHLVPDIRRGSAVKRLALYMRWMARPKGPVDLGLFAFSPSDLVIPVDTHIHRIARNLGLTKRPDASFRTALEITESLSRIDPNDPVRFDFALCHLGVSRACPSQRRDDLCGACVLRSVCKHWQPKRRAR